MLADEIGVMLRSRSETLAVAESCTGGGLGDTITEVAGSSDYFLGGVISYSNQAKVDLLGVSERVLEDEGAVSEKVAIQMAEGVMKRFKSTHGIGITGIAGPSGATRKKPVGLVYIAVSSKNRTVCKEYHFNGSRSEVKDQATTAALEMLRSALQKP